MKSLTRRPKMAGIPRSADQRVINAVVDAMDPITWWRWKKAMDERLERARGHEDISRQIASIASVKRPNQ